MKTNKYLFATMLFAFMFTSCAPRIVGTWNIDKYETKTPGQQGVALKNIGTITFKKRGGGEKNIQYKIFGTSKKDNIPFGWSKASNFLTIESRGSDFSKTWIITEDKRKMQKLQSTDGSNRVQTIELSKK